MEGILLKFIDASPFLAFLLVYIWIDSKREDKRVANASSLETRRENHEREMNNMWAQHIKSITDQIATSHQVIMSKLADHDKESQERYERMNITKDLIKAAEQQTQVRRK
jgi:hypothetical protein